MPKPFPVLPDNATNPEKTAQKVYNDDDDMVELNWNNISTVKRDVFRTLFDGLRRNTNLRALSLANTRLTDSAAEDLLEALRYNKTLRILNVESNYLSGNMLKVSLGGEDQQYPSHWNNLFGLPLYGVPTDNFSDIAQFC